jgi:hypothetical protein
MGGKRTSRQIRCNRISEGAMPAMKLVLTMALAVAASSPADAEDCVAASSRARGEWHYPRIIVDLRSGARLDAAALPEGTTAVMCPRPSIVPLPDDVRMLIEWGVAFGIANGPRNLWVSALHGRLEATVDDGELSASEQSAVDDWLATAQPRFTAAVTRR